MISLRAMAGQHFAVFGLARSGLAAARALIAGGAKDILGSYQNAFWVTGGLAAVGIIIALVGMRKPSTIGV